MAHTTITVDGITVLDAHLTQWQNTPPPELNQLARPQHPQPWMQPAMVVLIAALLNDQPLRIDVTTNGTGWSMQVGDHGIHL